MMTFKFRLLSDESDDFLLDIEVPYDMNLLELHNFIRKTLKYNPCEIASFFTSDVEWEKFREFTLIDMGLEGDTTAAATDDDLDDDDEFAPPIAMEKVILGQLMHERFQRLIYVFDMFAERQLFIELLESKPREANVEYPRIVTMEGSAPKQFIDE